MKWYIAVLTLAAPLMAGYGSPADQMFNQTAKQSYQVVGGADQHGASLVAVSPGASAQGSHQVTPPDHVAESSVVSDSVGTTLKHSAALQEEVAGLARSQIMFQQQTIESIRNISNQNRQLANEIQTLYQHVSVLEKQVSAPLAASDSSIQPWRWASLKHLFVTDQWGVEQYALLSVLFILVVFICYRTCFRKPVETRVDGQHLHVAPSQDEDDEGDYDYLQSEEGLGAQLDLARAYMAMKDYQAAENALILVKRSGDQAQKDAAESLWEQMEHAKGKE